jgi:hypothetical protein
MLLGSQAHRAFCHPTSTLRLQIGERAQHYNNYCFTGFTKTIQMEQNTRGSQGANSLVSQQTQSQPTQCESRSARRFIRPSYFATMLCRDEASVKADRFCRAVEVHVEEPIPTEGRNPAALPIWVIKMGEYIYDHLSFVGHQATRADRRWLRSIYLDQSC